MVIRRPTKKLLALSFMKENYRISQIRKARIILEWKIFMAAPTAERKKGPAAFSQKYYNYVNVVTVSSHFQNMFHERTC